MLANTSSGVTSGKRSPTVAPVIAPISGTILVLLSSHSASRIYVCVGCVNSALPHASVPSPIIRSRPT